MNQLFLLIYHICINQLCEDYYEVGNEHSVHGEWKNKFGGFERPPSQLKNFVLFCGKMQQFFKTDI